jgi:chromosome segregation ATPase
MEMINDFLVKKKEYVISERKRIIQVNEELKREIEAQNQLYSIRIQKKLKENTSAEYRKMEEHLLNVNNKICELEAKIDHEMEKIKSLKREIIKLTIELRNKNEFRDMLVESVDGKLKEITECKLYLDDLTKTNNILREKVNCFVI